MTDTVSQILAEFAADMAHIEAIDAKYQAYVPVVEGLVSSINPAAGATTAAALTGVNALINIGGALASALSTAKAPTQGSQTPNQ